MIYSLEVLENQWLKSIQEFSTAKVWICGTPQPESFDVILSMQGQIDKIPQEIRNQIGCLIVDEAHLFCTQIRAETLMKIRPKFLIGLTATYEKENGMQKVLDLFFGKLVVCHRRVHVTVHKLETEIGVSGQRNAQGKVDWNVLQNELAENEVRNQFIVDFLMMNKEYKILAFTSRVNHAKVIYNMLKGKDSVAVMTGKEKSYSDSRILIGTSGKLGTGFDDAMACQDFDGTRFNMIVFLFSMKSLALLEQLLGRGCRIDNPILVDFVDDHAILRGHWNKRNKYYKERKYTIKSVY